MDQAGRSWIVRSAQDIAHVRRSLAAWMTSVDPTGARVDELLLAVSELMTNGVEAGIEYGRVWVRVDATPHDNGVVVRVRNQGLPYGPVPPDAIEMPPGGARRGRGLAIVSLSTSQFDVEGQIGGTEARVVYITSHADDAPSGDGAPPSPS